MIEEEKEKVTEEEKSDDLFVHNYNEMMVTRSGANIHIHKCIDKDWLCLHQLNKSTVIQNLLKLGR